MDDVLEKEILQTLETPLDFIRYGASLFREKALHFGHGTDNPWDDAWQLVCYAIYLPLDTMPEAFNGRLLEKEKARILEFFEKRVETRLPTPYITGEAWFAHRPFMVDERVLIPRSPIGELIQNGFEPWIEEEEVHDILDLCTGSGALGITAALHYGTAHVDAVDISEEALTVADHNVARHHVDDQVTLLQGDLFGPIGDKRYDIIISNPPYVGKASMETLPAEYRHEPTLALEAAEEGLDLIRRILDGAKAHLKPDGILVVEVGESAEAVIASFPDLPLVWLQFDNGGEGIFMVTAKDLA